MISIRARTPLYATESEEMVAAAIQNIFPGADVRTAKGMIEAKSADAGMLGELIARGQIRDTARMVLQRGMDGGGRRMRFRLNKQVATVGKVNFVTERHAMGDIEVGIEGDEDELIALVDRIAPCTGECRSDRDATEEADIDGWF